jgi:acetoin:2,6-dichlorophenolindophenol oxidoreductase subunit beta
MSRQITYGQAIREALVEEMRRDPTVILYGEDVAVYGGIFRVLAGLREEFGDRVFDTPISENVIAGAAVGAAMAGLRPVAELQFADFVHCAADEVILKAGTWRYAHDGAVTLPLVIRAPSGGMGFGPEHSQCPEAYIMHSPGLRLAVPSTPADAKGLLKTAIRMDDPVVFFEHKLLYGVKGDVPDGDHLAPFGKAKVRREGSALTIVAWQEMLRRSLEAAERLAAEGIDVEIVDPVTLNPFDRDTIIASVRKTGACMVVEEAYRTLGVGAEIGAMLMERSFADLDRPFRRLAIPDVPIPTAPHLVDALVPRVDDIMHAARELAPG